MPYEKDNRLVLILAQTMSAAEAIETEVQDLGYFTLSATNRDDFLKNANNEKYGAIIANENCKYNSGSLSPINDLGQRVAILVKYQEPESRVAIYASKSRTQSEIKSLKNEPFTYMGFPVSKTDLVDFFQSQKPNQ